MSDTDTQICCPRCGELSCLDPDSKECSDNCITRLQRELAQARQDAERYRWLRDVGDSTWCPLLEHSRLAFPHVPVNELPSMIDEIISAAIDAAMKEEK